MTDPVGVVIVHRRQPERCWATLTRFADQGVPVNVVIVDNESTPEALERLASHPLKPTIIATGRNTGFGPGLNVGLRRWLRQGSGEWVAAAPHDALLEAGGLARLIELAGTRERAGVLCADVGDQATPMIDPYLGALPGRATVREGWEPAHYPHGTLMLFRRACLEDIGLFDERYFAYNDEADIGIRARAGGWEVGLARGVMVENPSTATRASVIDYLRLRNTLMMQHDHFGRWPAAMRTAIGVVNVGHAAARPSIRPPWYTGSARLLGIRDALLRRWGPPPDAVVNPRSG